MNQLDSLINAIASVESGHSYSAIGKKTSSGDKAYGKFQVMGANIPSWTKEATGTAMTAKEFLNNPQAQEKVARTRMSTLLAKYGNPADVASVWFTGRPLAKAGGNVKDVTGTTNNQYVTKVLAAMGRPEQKTSVSHGPQIFASLKNAFQNLTGTNPALHYSRVSNGPAPRPLTMQPYKLDTLKPSTPPLLKRFSERLGKITTPFGGSTTQEGSHPGVDIAGRMGTPIPTTTPGVVVASDNGHVQGENNYGNKVAIRDPDGNTHQYSHLKQSYVPVGQRVRPGQVVGAMGNSGAAYSPSGQGDGVNLDYRIATKYGQYKNPMTFLRGLV